MLEQASKRDLLAEYAGADMAFAIGDEELEQGLRLVCIGSPLSDDVLDA